jgi:hypothetical protein
MNVSAGSYVITLPSSVNLVGQVFIIKSISSGSQTIKPNGSETIDGASSVTLNQYDVLSVASDGSNWLII